MLAEPAREIEAREISRFGNGARTREKGANLLRLERHPFTNPARCYRPVSR